MLGNSKTLVTHLNNIIGHFITIQLPYLLNFYYKNNGVQ